MRAIPRQTSARGKRERREFVDVRSRGLEEMEEHLHLLLRARGEGGGHWDYVMAAQRDKQDASDASVTVEPPELREEKRPGFWVGMVVVRRCWWGPVDRLRPSHSACRAWSFLSLRFTRPAVLLASIFSISLHVAFRTRLLYKGPHVECALAIGPGAAGASDSGRPERTSLLIASPPPKSHRVRRHRAPVFGPCKIRGTKAHAECAPPMSTALAHNAGIVIAARVPFGAFSCLAFAGWHGCACQSGHAHNTKTWA